MLEEKEREKVLVTGAAGFVGSNLVQELIKRQKDVVCLLHPDEDHHRIKDLDVNIVRGDITRKETLTEVVGDVDYIYHLAGKLGGNDDDAFYRVNFVGTKNLVESCLEKRVKLRRFLFTSSLAAVGPSGKDNILNEESPCQPVSHYGESKLEAEKYLNRLGPQKFPYTTVRLPLVYGPGSNGGLFMFFKALNKHLRISPKKNETNVCFVQDVIEGMINAALGSKTLGKTYILAENKVYSSEDVFTIISEVLGKWTIKIPLPTSLLYALAVVFEGYAKIFNTSPVLTRNELMSYQKYRFWRFSSTKAAKDFGFQIRFPLPEGVKITADWYKKNNLI